MNVLAACCCHWVDTLFAMLITARAVSTALLAICGLSMCVGAEISLKTSLTRESSIEEVYAAVPNCTVSK